MTTEPGQKTPEAEEAPTDEFETFHPEDLATGDPAPPSPHVIGESVSTESKTLAAPKPEAQAAPDPLEIKDASGRRFDPEKHLLGADGKPAYTKGGYFKIIPKNADPATAAQQTRSIADRMRDGWSRLTGRAAPQPAPRTEPEPLPERESEPKPNPFREGSALPPPPPSAPQPRARDEAEAAAQKTVALEEMIAVMVFSEEWQFLPVERQALVSAWAKTYEEKGIVEMPWWMELATAHAVIATARMHQPKTQAKIGRLKGWVMKKIVDARTARRPEARANDE